MKTKHQLKVWTKDNVLFVKYNGRLFKVMAVLVDPKMAHTMIKKNVKNRNKRPKHITNLAKAITDNKFITNGATIVFDEDGNLQDGQHRLYAIIEANEPALLFIIKGVDPLAFETIDKGKNRSLKDDLQVDGETNCGNLAKAVSTCIKMERGDHLRQGVWPSHSEARNYIDTNETIRDRLSFVKNNNGIAWGGNGLLAGIYHQFAKSKPDLAEDFMTGVLTGTDLKEGDPRLALRGKIISVSNKKIKVDTHDKAFM